MAGPSKTKTPSKSSRTTRSTSTATGLAPSESADESPTPSPFKRLKLAPVVPQLLPDPQYSAEELAYLTKINPTAAGVVSPRTSRANGVADPEYCANCVVKGAVCIFTNDGRSVKKDKRKPACDSCAVARTACRKAPRRTWAAVAKVKHAVQVFGADESAFLISLVDGKAMKDIQARVDLARVNGVASWPYLGTSSVGYDVDGFSEYEEDLLELQHNPGPSVEAARENALIAGKALDVALETLEQAKLLYNLQFQTLRVLNDIRVELQLNRATYREVAGHDVSKETYHNSAAAMRTIEKQSEEIVQQFRASSQDDELMEEPVEEPVEENPRMSPV